MYGCVLLPGLTAAPLDVASTLLSWSDLSPLEQSVSSPGCLVIATPGSITFFICHIIIVTVFSDSYCPLSFWTLCSGAGGAPSCLLDRQRRPLRGDSLPFLFARAASFCNPSRTPGHGTTSLSFLIDLRLLRFFPVTYNYGQQKMAKYSDISIYSWPGLSP